MKSVILGAGTYGKVYLSYLKEKGIDVVGFLDDNPSLHERKIDGVPVLGTINKMKDLKDEYDIDDVYCPIGDNKLRVRLLKEAKALGYQIPNYIHPSVIISPDVKIGEGVYILLGTTIMPHSIIHDYVMISMGVRIAHHSVFEEGVFLSSGCVFGASITAQKYAYCGLSSTIMTGVKKIGEDCLIGAGAVVIRDVDDRAVMAGVPAKLLRYK